MILQTNGFGGTTWFDESGNIIPEEAVQRWMEAEQTLRDQFAMAALPCILEELWGDLENDKDYRDSAAQFAYAIADAMLEARAQEVNSE